VDIATDQDRHARPDRDGLTAANAAANAKRVGDRIECVVAWGDRGKDGLL
jgi:hypothetical protein